MLPDGLVNRDNFLKSVSSYCDNILISVHRTMKVTVKILQGSECSLEVSEISICYGLSAGRDEKDRPVSKRDK